MRILYVDDEPDIREIAEMSLSLDPDFQVKTAGCGLEALDLMAEWRPDAALLDVMMPGMDGPSLLDRIRKHADYARLPVIFVTARAQSAEIQNFALKDAVGVIAKPFDPMTLAAQVKAMLPK